MLCSITSVLCNFNDTSTLKILKRLTLLQKNRHTDIVLATRADAVCLYKACRSVVCSRATAPALASAVLLAVDRYSVCRNISCLGEHACG